MKHATNIESTTPQNLEQFREKLKKFFEEENYADMYEYLHDIGESQLRRFSKKLTATYYMSMYLDDNFDIDVNVSNGDVLTYHYSWNQSNIADIEQRIRRDLKEKYGIEPNDVHVHICDD